MSIDNKVQDENKDQKETQMKFSVKVRKRQ